MTCPVVLAINEIRGGGIYDDTAENDCLIKIGGSDSLHQYVCDNMSFYIMTRKLDLARFELSMPDQSACEKKYHDMFNDIIDLDYSQVYQKLISGTVKKKFLYNQFIQMVEVISLLENTLDSKIEKMCKLGKPINVSIPDITFLPNIDELIMYRPDILTITTNKIIDYINNLNINSILKSPITSKVDRVPAFAGDVPVMTNKINVEAGKGQTNKDILLSMHAILSRELVVAEHVRNVEKYHCIVINYLNKVYDICRQIIDGISEC